MTRAGTASRALLLVLAGGLVAGALDITDACVYWGYKKDVPAMRVMQSVASGVLGKEAYNGGAATAALGLLLHFFISICASIFFYAVARRLRALVRHAVISGILYGLAFYYLMTFVVVPLSASPGRPFLEWNGYFTHTIFFGLPIALFSRWAIRSRQGEHI